MPGLPASESIIETEISNTRVLDMIFLELLTWIFEIFLSYNCAILVRAFNDRGTCGDCCRIIHTRTVLRGGIHDARVAQKVCDQNKD